MTDGDAVFNECPGVVPATGPGRIVYVAAAALVDADGRVLVAQRTAGRHAGEWEFPGGKLEAGERPEQALIRELDEELGIRTAESCLAPCGFASHDYGDFHLVLLLFACRKWQGRPEGRQGQPVKWVRVPELFNLEMPPADRPLLGLLAALL